MILNIEGIARICHDANRAYCIALHDYSQVPWERAPQWQRDSAIKGVEYALAHPQGLPSDQHHSWMRDKIQDGWMYGDIKDPIKKTHPCLVDYKDLPRQQQIKDRLFINIVRSFL